MVTIKSYTDIDQSKKLAEILPLESADMTFDINRSYLVPTVGLSGSIKNNLFSYRKGYIMPGWSLAALINVLPSIQHLKPILDLEENSIQYSGTDIYVKADNPVDACYEAILKLHELKWL